MKAVKTMAVVAALATATAWGAGQRPAAATADAGYRKAVQAAFDNAKAGLAESPIPAGVPVAVLPIAGDADGWLMSLANGALTGAGKNCVVGKEDPMWDTIIEEIEWDERKGKDGADILDEETIDHFGRLQSAKVLVAARVDAIQQTERRWKAEVALQAVEIATKRYLWIGRFTEKTVPGSGSGARPASLEETPCPLNAKVSVEAEEGAERVGEMIESYARGRLADMGYRVDSGKEDDLTLRLSAKCRLFDQTLNWWMHEGEVKATLAAHGGAARTIGEATFTGQGARGRGEVQSQRNLADELEGQLSTWLRKTLDGISPTFAAVRMEFALANPVETKADYRAIDELQKGLAGLEGVRSARVTDQNDEEGTVAMRVVYDPERLPTGVADALFAAHPELMDYLQ